MIVDTPFIVDLINGVYAGSEGAFAALVSNIDYTEGITGH